MSRPSWLSEFNLGREEDRYAAAYGIDHVELSKVAAYSGAGGY